MTATEIRFWNLVSSDLGIEIVTPFETVLPYGTQLSASALVKDFGATRGMIIVANYNTIESHVKALIESGYGFSAMASDPKSYDRAVMIEVLADWGWTGDPAKKPDWLI